jgi:hypothetical protein
LSNRRAASRAALANCGRSYFPCGLMSASPASSVESRSSN